MKKIIYCLAFLGAIFTGCNPNEDIYNDIDAQENVISGDVDYTLTDEDYDELEKSFGNFNSEDEAKTLIPSLLADKYPVWGSGSSANVTFDLYSPKKEEKSIIRYTVTTEDYDSNPETERFNNFDDVDQIYDLLNVKYPSPSDRALVSLTYKYYDGSTNTLNNGFLYINDGWEFISGFTGDEYEIMGEGFSNFSSEDEAIAKIPTFLKDKFKFDPKAAGDIVATMYKLYTTDVDDLDEDGRTDDSTAYSYVKYFLFDGASWSEYNDVISSTIQFGHDGTTWVPDNTIKYTLTDADYELVDNGFYSNFDVRGGKDEELIEVRVGKINTILLNNFPGDEEGQKYAVSYNVYNGTNAVYTTSVIKSGGEYILSE